MRLERPAASTSAAMLRRRLHRLVARLRPGDDLHQQAADAHAGDVLARHRQAGEQAASAPSRSRSPSGCARSRARRAPDVRQPMPINSRLPGSTGMPKCSIWPPIASSAAGMTSRRSAIAEAPNTMTSSAPCLSTSPSARASAALFVRHAPLGDDRGVGRRKPLGGDLQRLVDHLRRKAGQERRDDADLADPIGRDAHQRLRRRGERLVARRRRHRERNDLHRCDHLAGDDRLVGRQRRHGDRLVDAVEAVDRILVDDQHAGRIARTDWRGR